MFILDLALPVLMAFYILCVVVTGVFCKKIKTKYKFSYFALFELYIIGLIKVVVMPIFILNQASKEYFLTHIGKETVYAIQVIPFKTIYGNLMSLSMAGIVQVVGNVVLLMPVAFFMVWIIQVKKKSIVYGLGILVTVLIEGVQYLINILTTYPSHAVDIDDVILNYTGYLLAILIICLIKKYSKPFFDKVRSVFLK